MHVPTIPIPYIENKKTLQNKPKNAEKDYEGLSKGYRRNTEALKNSQILTLRKRTSTTVLLLACKMRKAPTTTNEKKRFIIGPTFLFIITFASTNLHVICHELHRNSHCRYHLPGHRPLPSHCHQVRIPFRYSMLVGVRLGWYSLHCRQPLCREPPAQSCPGCSRLLLLLEHPGNPRAEAASGKGMVSYESQAKRRIFFDKGNILSEIGVSAIS